MDSVEAGSITDKDPMLGMSSIPLIENAEGVNVTVTKDVPIADREALWTMVQDGFQDLNRRSYEKQDMTFEEFSQDMDSPDVLKYIATNADQQPIGCLLVHIGLEGIDWADGDQLLAAQSKVDPAAQPYYITTVVVPPDQRGSEAAASLLRGAFIHFNEVNTKTSQNSLCLFDCADANYPWLADFIAKSANTPVEGYAGVPVEIRELSTEYYVKEPEGEVVKAKDLPQSPSREVVDKQHFYSIEITHPA
ncbi:MAG TPA: hypothetical protein VK712_00925 [Verrucomicrobiae bacterium]|jgi:hypothetical protein|nr:hypothetical protein [Verrucomicrobiae bacterium]